MSLKKIKAFFETYHFTDKEIRLDQCTVIKNQKKFVESMISILEANSGKKQVMPYYNHLLRFYNKVKDE